MQNKQLNKAPRSTFEKLGSLFEMAIIPSYNDEPKFFQYRAKLKSDDNDEYIGFGCDKYKEIALIKAIYESIERRSLKFVAEGTKESIYDKSNEHLDPRIVSGFSHSQLKESEFSQMKIHDNSEFSWVEVESPNESGKIWIPSQLVFWPYCLNDEPILRFPSTNGSSCDNLEILARCKSILELFERDAFMIAFLTKRPFYRIQKDLISDPDLIKIFKIYERYNLELHLSLIESNWDFPVVVATIIDSTKIGPTLTIGLKCHFNINEAMKGAIYEAQQMRPFLRDYILENDEKRCLDNHEIVDYWTRAVYWSYSDNLEDISFIYSEEMDQMDKYIEKWSLTDSQGNDWDQTYQNLLRAVKKSNSHIYFYTANDSLLDDLGVHVTKAIIPEAHPIYLDERYPYLNSLNLSRSINKYGPRWNDINSRPIHPFA